MFSSFLVLGKLSDHFLFFLGCTVSPAQTRTERDLSLQGFPNGYSPVGRHLPWPGTVQSWGNFSTGEMMYLRSSETHQHCCKDRRGHSVVLLGTWLTAGQLTKGAVCLLWLWAFPVNHWRWWLLACVCRLYTAHQQILRLCRWRWRDHINQMREEIVAWLFT